MNNSSPTETDLIRAARSSDRRAQGELYARYAPYSLAILRRYGVADGSRADVLQEIFVEVFTKLDRYDAKKGAFTTWLRQITVFRCIDHQRRRAKLRYEPVTDYQLADRATENHLARLEAADLLALIAELPLGYRTVFNLYAVEGYRHQEISSLLNITEATSRSQYHRARERLREALIEKSKVSRYVK